MPKQKNKRQKLYIFMVGLMLGLASTAVFAWYWITKFNGLMDRAFLGKGNYLIVLLYFMIYTLTLKAFGALRISYHKLSNTLLGQFFGVAVAHIAVFAMLVLVIANTWVMKEVFIWVAQLWGISTVMTLLLTFILTKVYGLLVPPYRVLELYGDHPNNLDLKVNQRADLYKVTKRIYVGNDLPAEDLVGIQEEMFGYDAVIINDIKSSRKNKLMKFAYKNDIRVYVTPKLSDIMVRGAQEVNLFDSPLILCENGGLTFGQALAKRIADIALSVLGLIVTLPFTLVTAIAIKLEDHGPIFYKQERVTMGGRKFFILKFRSMVENAERDGKPRPAGEDDDRITKVGRVIRSTRIDELPQLLNILKGDMSIVGPRPERVEHMEKYSEFIPEFSYRLKVKGGLTGYAQVYGRYNTTAYDKLKMDLMYIVNYSFWLDIQILFETIKVIFQKESTEGFSDEQIAIMREEINKEDD